MTNHLRLRERKKLMHTEMANQNVWDFDTEMFQQAVGHSSRRKAFEAASRTCVWKESPYRLTRGCGKLCCSEPTPTVRLLHTQSSGTGRDFFSLTKIALLKTNAIEQVTLIIAFEYRKFARFNDCALYVALWLWVEAGGRWTLSLAFSAESWLSESPLIPHTVLYGKIKHLVST